MGFRRKKKSAIESDLVMDVDAPIESPPEAAEPAVRKVAKPAPKTDHRVAMIRLTGEIAAALAASTRTITIQQPTARTIAESAYVVATEVLAVVEKGEKKQ